MMSSAERFAPACRSRLPSLQHAGFSGSITRINRADRLWLAPDSRRALVPNFAAAPRRRLPGKEEIAAMIVGLDLHQYTTGSRVPALPMRPVDPEKTVALRPDDAACAIGGEHSGGIARVSGANHRKTRTWHRDAVDDEPGVEYLVPAISEFACATS